MNNCVCARTYAYICVCVHVHMLILWILLQKMRYCLFLTILYECTISYKHLQHIWNLVVSGTPVAEQWYICVCDTMELMLVFYTSFAVSLMKPAKIPSHFFKCLHAWISCLSSFSVPSSVCTVCRMCMFVNFNLSIKTDVLAFILCMCQLNVSILLWVNSHTNLSIAFRQLFFCASISQGLFELFAQFSNFRMAMSSQI